MKNVRIKLVSIIKHRNVGLILRSNPEQEDICEMHVRGIVPHKVFTFEIVIIGESIFLERAFNNQVLLNTLQAFKIPYEVADGHHHSSRSNRSVRF